MEKEQDRELLDKGYVVIMIVWGVLFLSQIVFLCVCLAIKETWQISTGPDFPIEKLKYVLYGVVFVELVIAYFLRRHMLQSAKRADPPPGATPAHPAVTRYLSIILAISALVEGIGIYGVVLFLLAKDMLALYQLIALSVIALIHFRPRKEELLELAQQMDR